MTSSLSALLLNLVLLIPGPGVRPAGEPGRAMLDASWLILGGVGPAAAGHALVGWETNFGPKDWRSEGPTACYLSYLPEPRTDRSAGDEDGGPGVEPATDVQAASAARARARELFGRVRELGGMCCNGHLELRSLADSRLAAATTCAGEAGTWIYAKILNPGGEVGTTPLPVAPAPGRDQERPSIAPSMGGGAWVVWTESDQVARLGATVRAVHLDPRGEIDRGPFDLSSAGEALPDSLSEHLAVTPVAAGGFAASWYAETKSGEAVLRVARFDSAGTAAAKPAAVPAVRWSTKAGSTLRLDADSTGGLSIVWQRRGETPDDPERLAVASISAKGEPLVPPTPVAVDEPRSTQSLGRFVTVGRHRLLVWAEHDPRSGEDSLAFRLWSPERGPIGLTERFPAALASKWPFLEAVVDGASAVTLYWAPDGPEGLAIPGAVAWQRFEVGETPWASPTG